MFQEDVLRFDVPLDDALVMGELEGLTDLRHDLHGLVRVQLPFALQPGQGILRARNIKRLAPSEPILMINGSASEPIGTHAFADVVLNRPFGFNEPRQAVAQLLGSMPGELGA